MKAAEDLRISAENINNMLNNSLQKISATRKRTRKLKAVSILRKKREKKETKIEVPSVFKKSVRKIQSKVSSVSSNLFTDILGFVSLIVLGTVITNIDNIKEAIDKMREKMLKNIEPFTDVVKAVFSGVEEFISGFGSFETRNEELENIKKENERLKKLQSDFDKIGKDFEKLDKTYKDVQSGKYGTDAGYVINKDGQLSTGETFSYDADKKTFSVTQENGNIKVYPFEEFFNKYSSTDLENIVTKDPNLQQRFDNINQRLRYDYDLEKNTDSIYYNDYPYKSNIKLLGSRVSDTDLLGDDDSLFSETTTVVAVQRVIVDKGGMA
tara:strand:+ start:115 stop:1089 length:975 start_codon:yes stop_codon:yes gene_type:complete